MEFEGIFKDSRGASVINVVEAVEDTTLHRTVDLLSHYDDDPTVTHASHIAITLLQLEYIFISSYCLLQLRYTILA